MTAATSAVFVSYASQDAMAANRIAAALRAAEIEVWLDQSAHTGGDQWDGKIRSQIGSRALFIPVISAATQPDTRADSSTPGRKQRKRLYPDRRFPERRVPFPFSGVAASISN